MIMPEFTAKCRDYWLSGISASISSIRQMETLLGLGRALTRRRPELIAEIAHDNE